LNATGGGGGAATLISTQTANNTANNFTWLNLTGKHYQVRCNIQVATNAADLAIQFSTDNSTFDAGAAAYEWAVYGITIPSFGAIATGSAGDTGFRIRSATPGFSNTAHQTFTMSFFDLNNAAEHRVIGHGTILDGAPAKRVISMGGTYLTGTTAVQGIRIVASSGNLNAGSCSLYQYAAA
jgi:hypothetical protein